MISKLDLIKKKEKIESIRLYKEKSLIALQKLVKTRCTTTFIGALDSIEQKFGYLWGHGKNQDSLSERERLFLQLWKDLRKEILDKGNLQTKTLIKELESFEVILKDIHFNTIGGINE